MNAPSEKKSHFVAQSLISGNRPAAKCGSIMARLEKARCKMMIRTFCCSSLAAFALLVPTHAPQAATPPARATAVFAGGCFWGVEAVFEHLKGVVDVVSGFAGGTTKKPGYEEVSTGRTGYAESVLVTYDPAQISYETLLQVFFSVAHDPTQLNRQGPDVGTQYRSAIFFADEAQQKAARAYIDKLTKEKA